MTQASPPWIDAKPRSHKKSTTTSHLPIPQQLIHYAADSPLCHCTDNESLSDEDIRDQTEEIINHHMQNGATYLTALDITLDEVVYSRSILHVRRSFEAFQAADARVKARDRMLLQVENNERNCLS